MKNLKRLRGDAGLTQYGLAGATGIHRWRIAHAEKGIIKLTADETETIRKALLDASRKKSARLLGALGVGEEPRNTTEAN